MKSFWFDAEGFWTLLMMMLAMFLISRCYAITG